jgi:CBS domain-containing protein
MKLTQPKKVMDIVHPPLTGIPAAPSVDPSDPVMRAVELMVKNNLTVIAVSVRGSSIGHIQLAEALAHLGLKASFHLSTTGAAPQRK